MNHDIPTSPTINYQTYNYQGTRRTLVSSVGRSGRENSLVSNNMHHMHITLALELHIYIPAVEPEYSEEFDGPG